MSGFAQLLEAAAFAGLAIGAVFTGAARRTGLLGSGLAVAGLCAEAGDVAGLRLAGAVTLVLAAESGWRARVRIGRSAARLGARGHALGLAVARAGEPRARVRARRRVER